ncbi:DUF4230 domain-containing protein [Aggregicoccus sp. 17bor-14]|uniref:DUF4230 domain-containing protein n=1 Tax=Myxococcaceae TaxID=31 RepID=UPI00129D2125|nr:MULTISPECIES: DUF4230 domain-containing protein [Myxococcaceae]MBF5042441.1 DUF4230 domain-containing protein [Simulacricoccus sp. 17bor-14]MRI88212.1 DUF4230 domain-containing protein [Aggregicoccus sp. 17bor-14]
MTPSPTPPRALSRLLLVLLGLGAGALIAWLALRPAPQRLPDGPTVVEQMREVARLETLEVSLYKKVDFTPEPPPPGSLWRDVLTWGRYSVNPPRGKVLVFADAQLGYDFGAFDARSLHVEGTRVDVKLPPLKVQVQLKPAETEVIGSNLDTAETAQLLEHARAAFEQEVSQDARLRERARGSAERSLRGLLLSLGYREVRFVERLPDAGGAG